jgi:hypothetical protein
MSRMVWADAEVSILADNLLRCITKDAYRGSCEISSDRTIPSPLKVGANMAVMRGIGKWANFSRLTPEKRAFSLRVDDVVEESSELGAAKLGFGIGCSLHDCLKFRVLRQ